MAELFGYPVYRVSEVENGERDAAWRRTLHSASRVFAYARIDTGDVASTHPLVEDGFRVVDVTVRFTRAPFAADGPLPGGVRVRAAQPSDFDRVVAIAGTAFRYSRFHLDPLVPRHLADDVKRAWMESYRLGTRGSGCLVATVDDLVVGFLAIVESSGPEVAWIIDLIGVDPDAQGRGVGRALVETFAHEARDRAARLEVGTQAANAASVRLYENCGFRFSGAAYVLHAHLRTDRPA